MSSASVPAVLSGLQGRETQGWCGPGLSLGLSGLPSPAQQTGAGCGEAAGDWQPLCGLRSLAFGRSAWVLPTPPCARPSRALMALPRARPLAPTADGVAAEGPPRDQGTALGPALSAGLGAASPVWFLAGQEPPTALRGWEEGPLPAQSWNRGEDVLGVGDVIMFSARV